MALIRKIERLANSVAPHYSNIHIHPRGLPFFEDRLLRGTVRFARRSGNDISMLNPDNETFLSAQAGIGKDRLVVTKFLAGFIFNSIVSIGPDVERRKVIDFSASEKDLKLDAPLRTIHPVDTPVWLHGFPILANAPYTKGDTVIQIRSKVGIKLVNGDIVTFEQIRDILGTLVEFNVITAEFLSTSPQPDGFDLNYELVLAEPISRDLEADELFWVRGFPAYVSQEVAVPDNTITVDPIGPFLLDYLSGSIMESTFAPQETFSIILTDQFGTPIIGPIPETRAKNTGIYDVPIAAHVPLFWDVLFGSFLFRQDRLIAVCDENGEFAVSTKVQPQMPAGHEWTLPVNSENSAVISVQFTQDPPTDPTAHRVFNVLPATNTNLAIGATLAENPVDRIEIAIKSPTPGNRVTLFDWSLFPSGTPRAFNIQYHLVSHVVGEGRWQASGIIVKPYFLQIDYVKGKYDVGDKYNAGKIYF